MLYSEAYHERAPGSGDFFGDHTSLMCFGVTSSSFAGNPWRFRKVAWSIKVCRE